MKKHTCLFSLVILFCLVLSGCFWKTMILPNNDTIGEPKTFQKDGITLVLTDKFKETKSQMGFDAYYTSDFCGVVVLKESFSLKAGLSNESIEEYIGDVIKNNGHTNVKAQNRDGLWFYESVNNGTKVYSYSFKGSDAFWIVQYICRISDSEKLEDQIFLWAKSIRIE